MILTPSKRYDLTEYLDDPNSKIDDLRVSLKDIQKFNSFLKTKNAVLSYVKLIINIKKLTGKIRILDLCSGSADIPVFIAEWARVHHIDLEITAIDINENIIKIANEEIQNYPEIKVEVQDAFNLPYKEDEFNICICSQAFHHFSDDDCIKLLKVMYKFSKHGFVVNDLRRDWVNYFFAIALGNIFKVDYMSKKDAPTSVLRAFTKEEFEKIAYISDIPNIKCHTYFLHSLQLLCIK